MKKILVGFVIVLVLLVAAVVALPFIVPMETVKKQLITAANDATGRTLAIDGNFELSVFPTLGLKAEQVSFSNPPGSTSPNMAAINSLTAELELMPLLGGQIKVARFVLDQPVVNLEIDEKGNPNWVLDGKKAAPAAAAQDSTASQDTAPVAIKDINLGDVRLINGVISYTDKTSGTAEKIENLNLDISLASLDSPLDSKGSAVWNGEKINLAVTVGALRAIMDNKPTFAKTSISSSKVALNFEGDINTVTPVSLSGRTDLDVPSLRELAAWAGAPLEVAGDGFGPLKIAGNVAIEGDKYSFNQASLSFDKINGKGDFSINLGGKKPAIKGKLALAELDVNPYLPPEDPKAAKAATAQDAKPKGPGEWDDTPIDLSALNDVNADFDLSVEKVLVRKIKIGKSVIIAALKDGLLNLNLKQLALYEGKANGVVTVDARNAVPKITEKFALSGIQLQPLLTDAADFNRLEGTGLIEMAVNTTGRSQKEMVSALAGNGRILFTDGAINGINLAAMARNVTSAFTNDDAKTPQKTDFAELSGTYTIQKGIVTNKDLKMLNPFIRLDGKGKVSLPPRTVNYRLNPKIVASTEGQGGGAAGGLVVPVNISGPWHDLSYAPDLTGVVKGLVSGGGSAVTDTVKSLKKAGEGDVQGLVKSLGGALTGSKPATTTETTGTTSAPKTTEDPVSKIGNTLKSIFK